MNEIDVVRSMIYDIRGQKVMLDRDLASMYGVTTGNLNKAVKRNIGRFPSDFMFRLTVEEFEAIKPLIFQNGISKGRGGTRYMPYAFTEQGVAMLSSVLNSETAIRVNIGIMRAFVSIRHMLSQPKQGEISQLQAEMRCLKEYVNDILTDQNDINEETRMQLEMINESLAELQAERRLSISVPRPKVGFDIGKCL